MEGQVFCESCGERLKEGVERREVMPRTGGEITDQHRKHIRSARFAIMFVAIVTIGVSIFFWFKLKGEIENIPPGLLVDGAVKKAIAFQKAAVASTFFLGLVFIGLFFWAKKNPFGASLTALIIYATSSLMQCHPANTRLNGSNHSGQRWMLHSHLAYSHQHEEVMGFQKPFTLHEACQSGPSVKCFF
jgi:hypothetical protein